MAVLVDACLWHRWGRRWCHCVSDVSLDELHAFAERLGVPRRAFQGDHYDLHEEGREAALALGAEAVSTRELLRRLKGAGLRLSPEQRRARRVHDPAGVADGPPPDLRLRPPSRG